ncbi:hypothetical protein GY21_16860 [Cryobacterium roopkundense]|uniref:Energy-coupling factor transporter ATP-binding protein EcfA2 n=1 Tax=Cryobacterium roopkundense TaxID=1001240 RepID=A0A099J1V8_9MICO|nr:hypothetical protein [Cryobacterium roopkundense]KGJ72226.1 hypothetical protein GY21_16860 [Cryobacterium roopkundense]MBB5642849.1 energy-coupling factor transporter ATP-binding protein EcfA2 [Cryobacterium roopkundense]
MTEDASADGWTDTESEEAESVDAESVDTQPIDLQPFFTETFFSTPTQPRAQSFAGVIGIDGHNGTGKTTIAQGVARALNASYQRPFAGEHGALLADANRAGDGEAVLRIGSSALTAAIRRNGPTRPIVLDRSWITVGSLLTDEEFYDRWNIWVPTILCWSDLPTTLERLGRRGEQTESADWHEHYIDRYRCMAEDRGCLIVNTGQCSDAEAIAEVVQAARRLLKWSAPGSTQPQWMPSSPW